MVPGPGKQRAEIIDTEQEQAITPIHVDVLKQQLKSHPNQNLVRKLCNELAEGARIGYNGPRVSRQARNLPTAALNPSKVTENITKEVSLGRTAGPFDRPPLPNFQVSPLGIIPKKHTEKFRTIFHLSYPKTGDSINSFIDKEEFSLNYVTVDEAIKNIQLLGPNVFMAKTDIESAFRLFPVHRDDWELLGMCWQGKYYFEKFLPFGLRSAPFLFNQLSEALEWILKEHCGISFVCHFLDDFLIMESDLDRARGKERCHTSLNSMLMAFKALGVPVSPGKTAGPANELEFLGIILDTAKYEARLPHDKLERLQEELKGWTTKKSATLVQLQSLIGSLNFACKVVPPGRPFLQRIINLTIGLKKPFHHVRLNQEFYLDIEMWQYFLKSWNGKAFFLNNYWESSNELLLFTDASGSLGYGGLFGPQWFQGAWQPHQVLGCENVSIAWQELYAIVVACAIWGKQWVRKRVLFKCDNLSVVHIINGKKAKCPKIMHLIRYLTLLTLQHNFYCRAEHVPGMHNEIADSLSRFQVSRFRQLAPWANSLPEQIPTSILQL